MDRNYALEPEEVAAGVVLACQSHPVADEVSLDYDAQGEPARRPRPGRLALRHPPRVAARPSEDPVEHRGFVVERHGRAEHAGVPAGSNPRRTRAGLRGGLVARVVLAGRAREVPAVEGQARRGRPPRDVPGGRRHPRGSCPSQAVCGDHAVTRAGRRSTPLPPVGLGIRPPADPGSVSVSGPKSFSAAARKARSSPTTWPSRRRTLLPSHGVGPSVVVADPGDEPPDAVRRARSIDRRLVDVVVLPDRRWRCRSLRGARGSPPVLGDPLREPGVALEVRDLERTIRCANGIASA